jgi:hypothetical protein
LVHYKKERTFFPRKTTMRDNSMVQHCQVKVEQSINFTAFPKISV